MFSLDMVPILCCPVCKSPDIRCRVGKEDSHGIEEGEILCSGCAGTYSISGGVPNLVPEQQIVGDQWGVWKEHLEGLKIRRRRRSGRRSFLEPDGRKLKEEFVDFSGMNEGEVLDVGCGGGDLRPFLDERRIHFYGLDPVVCIPEVSGFRFVRGLSEWLPFRDSTFSFLVVKAALDHFCNLFECISKSDRSGRENPPVRKTLKGAGPVEDPGQEDSHARKLLRWIGCAQTEDQLLPDGGGRKGG